MEENSVSLRAFLLVLLMLGGALVPLMGPAPDEKQEEMSEVEETMQTGGNGATFGPQTVSVGQNSNMCMIFANGTPMCRGNNVFGQLGDGTNNNSYGNNLANVLIPDGRRAKSIDSGYESSCMVLDNGSAMCWGRGDSGHLGLGNNLNYSSPEYVILPPGAIVENIESSRFSTCMLLTNGSVMCAGYPNHLGNGANSATDVSQFVSLPAGRTAVQMSLGYAKTCAVLDNGSAVCWGSGGFGGLGDGGTSGNGYPVYVQTPNGIDVQSISVGYTHSCMMLVDSSVACWGENDFGQLGDDTNNTSNLAVLVSLPSTISANRVSAGYHFTCADFDDGTVRCWGKGQHGRLGNSQTYSSSQYEPVAVNVSMPSGIDILNISVGDKGACSLNRNLSATCWGQLSNTGSPEFVFSSFFNHFAKPGDLIPHPNCLVNGTDTNTANNWVMCAGGIDGTVKVYGTDIDSSGNVYYGGIFSGTVFFGEQVLESDGTDSFVAKLSNDGEWLWTSQIGGSGDAEIRDLAVSSSGDIAVTGYFTTEAVIGVTTLNSSGSSDVFAAKLNSGGDWKWAKSFGGSYNDLGHENTFDSNGNIYVTGTFAGSIYFGSNSHSASGTTDVFVAKFSSSGSYLSLYSAGGTGSQSVGYSISVSSSGDVHVCGKFTGTSTFGSNSVSSNGGFDMFKATLSSSGSWSSILSAGGTGDDDAHVISVDSSGNSYITGSFENSFTLVGTTFTSNGAKDIFVAKLSSSNSWTWVTTAGGSGEDKGTGIDFDSNGNAFVTGVISGSVSIAGTTLTSNGLSDAFIGQVSSSGSWVWVNNGGSSSADKMYDISVDSNGFGYAGGYITGNAEIGIQNLTCSGTCAIMIKTLVAQSPAADGNISVNLEFDYENTWLKGNWQASSLVTGHDYNVSWTLEYQNNGTVISNGWPDSFYPQNTSYSSTDRTWASGVEGGKLVCYEVKLRDGDGFSGPILDTASSCARTPVELTELTSSDVSDAVQRSSAANCAANSNSNIQNNICDGNTGTNWVSADNYDPYNLTIDFDLGTSAVRVNAVAAYVNNPSYTSTIENARLQYLNETGDYVDIGIFQIDRTTGWQYFGGFSVTTTEIRWDVLSNHGFQHTVLFEGKVLDIPDKIFNSNGDWNSSNSLWTYSVAWGDVDSDGDLDLAVGNADDSYGPSEVYSNGGAALASSRSWASISNLDTRSVSWGDVDNDGDLDLAVGNLGNQNEIYLNTGTGLATTPTWTSTNSLQTYSIAWGDVDGDGDLDLAVGNAQANNEVYLNSNGEFATSADWTSENSLNTIVVVWVDVDSDGDLDLSVGNGGNDGNNEIYINSGTSLATAPDWTSSNSLSTSSVAWGDIDDDGHLDMVVANDGGSNELYLSNNGVLATTSAWTSNNSLNSKSIALGDVDGDGDLDMAVGNYNQNNEVYLYSNGAFTTTPAWTGALTQKTFSVAWGDVDGDGDLDLAIGEQQSKNQVYLNQLDSGGAGVDGLPDIDLGGPQPIFHPTADWTSSNSKSTQSVAWGDVDGDGDLDLAVGNDGQNNEVYLNTGTTLTSTPAWTSSNSLDTFSVAWGDVDGDGDLDLAVGNYGQNNEVYLNSGTALSTTPAWTSSNSLDTNTVVWGDVDGDGDLDLAVGNTGAANEVYLNTGTALATTPDWTSSNSQTTLSLAWGDVDGDGDLDLAVGNYVDANEVYLNNDGTLDTVSDWTSGGSNRFTKSVAWGDVDGDGDLDLAVGNHNYKHEVYLNNNGTLDTTNAWLSPENTANTESVAWGDLDGDGDLELVIGQAAGSSLPSEEAYLNNDGTLSTNSVWNSGTGTNTGTRSIALGDVDGDGDLDLAVGINNGVNKIYFNQLDDGGAGVDGLPDIDLVGGSDSEFNGQNLATGDSHSCAIQKNETLRCWGENNWGQLGSQQYDEGGQYSTPQYDVELPTGTVPLAVSAAYGYSCAIVDNGSNEAYCWGEGDNGKLGNGNLSNSNVPGNKVVLASGANPVYISSSDGHSCVVSDDEDIYCWGLNNQGQLGNGSQGGYSSIPTIVNSGVGYKSVSTGHEYTCAISIDGGLYCWGNNNNGQLGDGTYNQRNSPVQITSGPTSSIWKEVAVSGSHTCAISSSDEIYCWGLNNDGQLGDGTTDNANTPQLVDMPAGITAVSVSVGGSGFTCGVLENHSSYCWGKNERGYLGDGSWQDSHTPIAIDLPSGSEVVEISSGMEHSCILLANDQIMCWGWGGHGRLGTDSHDDSPSPEYVVGGHVWNGLGKDFYHFAPQISFPVEDSEPKLSIMIPLSPLPSSMAISMTSIVTLNHNGIIIETMSLEQENLSWIDTSNAEWWSLESFIYDVPSFSIISGWQTNSAQYCIEVDLRSFLTGESIGHGMECGFKQQADSEDGDFADDDIEDVWGSSTDTDDEDDDGYSDWIEYWYGGDFSDSEITPPDSDGDGLPDTLEDAIGTNVDDADTDGDGHDDYDEFMYGGRPLRMMDIPPNYDYDDCYDFWEEMFGLNSTNSDTDGDGVLDCFDTDSLDPDNTPMDSDGDGMPDGLEEGYGTNPENWDSDGDGMPDSFEIIMGTDPWDSNSHSTNWAADWDNILTFKPEASATASSSAAGHPASLIIDTDQEGWSNDTSYWTSSGPCPATIEVDLGSIQYLTHMEIGIIVPEEGQYPRNLSFEYRESSADDWILGQTFMNGDEGPSGDYWNGDAIPLSKARYVRLNCSDSTDDQGIGYEISIRTFKVWGAKNTQFINPDGNTGNQSSQPSIAAFLNIDSMNESITAGYSAQLTNGLDYDIDWRLVETNQGSCSDIPVSIDEGSLSIQNWDSAENGSFQQIFVDYSSVSNWNIELCLQLDLNQEDAWLYTDWILVSASGSQSNGTQNDADGDGVNDLFDLCPGTSPDAEVDSTGCPIDDGVETTHDTTLEVEFIENQRDSLWHQTLILTLDDPWVGYNHSLSIKLKDENGNTVYSYFSPMDESDQYGWWKLSSEMNQNPTELEIDLNWEGIVGNGRWEGSSRFFEDTEYPYFSSGNYCVEISLGYQNDSSLLPMDVVNDLFDKEEFCGEFLHESMEGVVWDGQEEVELSTLDKVMANKMVGTFLDFMDSTQGQILSIGLAILGFAGKMVMARGQRAKNKRVDKFSRAIRKAATKGRLKIIEIDIEKANIKNKLPRGGYGDLMEQIESQMESLGFDANPEQGETSGNWTSGDEQEDYAQDFQQAADMMWEAQDMMAEAKEEAAMTREAIESVQDQFGMRPQRQAAAEPEPEEVFNSKYVTQGIDGAGGGTGPSLPGGRMMDLDGDGIVTDEEKQIWSSMSQAERTEFFQPVTDIAGEIKRRNMLREKREKLNKGKRGSKKKKKGKKDKGRW